MPAFASIMKPSDWPLIRRINNGIPGPLLAKLSPLWKIYHVLNESYTQAVSKLHKRYGPLVQVGPNEFSLADKGLVYIPKLARTFWAVDLAALQQLEKSVKMANVFRYEPLIDKCNHQFLCLLADVAKTEERVELSPLLARYAYETMLATTTGKAAGFLTHDIDTKHVHSQLRDWKFYAIVYGSYLKFHPFIAKGLRLWGWRGDPQRELFREPKSADQDDPASEEEPVNASKKEEEQQPLLPDGTEARIALALAGADPAVVLIRTAMKHIYGDAALLQRLRDEIESVELSDPPWFSEIIARRWTMPELHAVLLECIRVDPPIKTGSTFTTREDDIQVGGHSMPKGTKVSLEPTVAHVNPVWFGDDADEFRPTRWRDFNVSLSTRRHLLAFNLAFDNNNLQEFQILLTCKLLIQLLRNFNMEFNEQHFYNLEWQDVMTVAMHGAKSFASNGARIDDEVAKTLTDAERFHAFLDEKTLKNFTSGGRFDIKRESFEGEKDLIITTITNPLAVAKFSEALQSFFGNKLRMDSFRSKGFIRVGPPRDTTKQGVKNGAYKRTGGKSTSYSNYKGTNVSQNNRTKQGTNNYNNTRVPRQDREMKPPQGLEMTEGQNKWGDWGKVEETHVKSFAADEKYKQSKIELEKAKDTAEKAGITEYNPKPAVFTQTIKKNDEGNKKEEGSKDRPAGFVPLHMRKRLAANN